MVKTNGKQWQPIIRPGAWKLWIGGPGLLGGSRLPDGSPTHRVPAGAPQAPRHWRGTTKLRILFFADFKLIFSAIIGEYRNFNRFVRNQRVKLYMSILLMLLFD